MATDPDERLATALDWTDRRGLAGVILGLIAGTFMELTYGVWRLIRSAGDTLMRPFQAFGAGLARLVEGSIGGPVALLRAATQAGVESLLNGVWGQLGIFAYPVTMFAVALGLYVFARMWEEVDLSPWNFLRNIRR